MTSGLMPLGGPSLAPLPTPVRLRRPVARPQTKPAAARRAEPQRLAWCALWLVLLLEGVLLFAPRALLLGPWQARGAFKVGSGYTLLALLAFALAFGALRRSPRLAHCNRALHSLHLTGGLLMLVLLALHAAARPGGFLLATFHAAALGQGAGALRALLGARGGRRAVTALLMLHIGGACLMAAAALVHVYLVYAYTA